MIIKLATDGGVDCAPVRHQVRGAIDVHDEQETDVGGGGIGNVEAAHVAVTLDERDDGFMSRRSAGRTITGLAANVGLVGFSNGVRTT